MEDNVPCSPSHGSEGVDRDICPSRISLRALDLSDVNDFMAWATDERVARFCTGEPYTNKEDAIEYIKDKIIPHPGFRAICLDDKAIGAISVCANSGNNACRGEIGYVLAYKYWGKGIAKMAVNLVVESVFKDWPHLERLEGLVDVDNLGSQKVLEKCGFVREGVLRKFCLLKGKSRDMVIFSWIRSSD